MKSEKKDTENMKDEKMENKSEENAVDETPESAGIIDENVEKLDEGVEDPRILELSSEINRLNDLIARERAEFINYRKRTSQESLQLEGRTAGKILQEILPAFDAFEQLLASSGSNLGTMEKFLEGAALIKRQLWQVFESLGVEEIDPVNFDFDPQIMEALSVQEEADATGEQVTQVYQKGYKYKDRVLRPARVAVKKPKPANN